MSKPILSLSHEESLADFLARFEKQEVLSIHDTADGQVRVIRYLDPETSQYRVMRTLAPRDTDSTEGSSNPIIRMSAILEAPPRLARLLVTINPSLRGQIEMHTFADSAQAVSLPWIAGKGYYYLNAPNNPFSATTNPSFPPIAMCDALIDLFAQPMETGGRRVLLDPYASGNVKKTEEGDVLVVDVGRVVQVAPREVIKHGEHSLRRNYSAASLSALAIETSGAGESTYGFFKIHETRLKKLRKSIGQQLHKPVVAVTFALLFIGMDCDDLLEKYGLDAVKCLKDNPTLITQLSDAFHHADLGDPNSSCIVQDAKQALSEAMHQYCLKSAPTTRSC